MKKIWPYYPRRAELLRTPFLPLSDDQFRRLVANGSAIPCREGGALFVSKWRDGPGLPADEFLAALRVQGSTLEARTFGSDANVRVVRGPTVGAPASHARPNPAKPTR